MWEIDISISQGQISVILYFNFLESLVKIVWPALREPCIFYMFCDLQTQSKYKKLICQIHSMIISWMVADGWTKVNKR